MAGLPFDDASAPLYSVGQVAEMLQVQQSFLRRLDEHEVVRPRRSAGGQRRYSREEVHRVRYVVRLVDEGMTLIAIRHILELERRVAELERERDEALRRLADLESRTRADGRRGPAA
ncbi:MerR family transcriptional regulator [Bailinhaonella thermotolerans]|uniref:MerR family transcriptional regulator n=1 Tax=Bailinhaonella thermotolerans TaxID=1070861 RepID=A0A3A4BHN3_9ACTN|nr:MerR family transcriptional regulator [Bailinhaonella thermotolerans]RJL30772.1 MerR family transcriptional regulator [Bailinhaonella thermotolerans]